MRLGSRFSVALLMSTNTGLAPTYKMQFAEATKLNGEVITSSPAPTPRAIRHKCKAAVPLLTPTAKREPTDAATADSNSSSFGPQLRRPERKTAATASMSASEMSGFASEIVLLIKVIEGSKRALTHDLQRHPADPFCAIRQELH